MEFLNDPNLQQQKHATSSIQSEIISHCESKFAKIMELDGITCDDIMKSLNIQDNVRNVFKAGEGVGQSGSFFFFSKDKKFLIKTMRGSEKKVLLGMLDNLIGHFKKTTNSSLLARIYGLFTIKTNVFKSVDVIIMQNTTRFLNKHS